MATKSPSTSGFLLVCLSTVAGCLLVPSTVLAQEREPREPAAAEQGVPEAVPPQAVQEEKALPGQATCGLPRKREYRPYPADRGFTKLQQAGKAITVDPMTGQPVYQHITDYLPAGWGTASPAAGQKVDSFGEPIVNERPGLPAWSARHVAALRQSIAEALAAVQAEGTPEQEFILGNYLGQALARGIGVDDLVDADRVSATVANATLDQLSFYESVKQLRAEDGGYVYERSEYGDDVAAFAEKHGRPLTDLLATAVAVQPKATPSGCYLKTLFTRGMSLLATGTDIWNTDGADDESADVPLGFLFYFYGCDDGDSNLGVRVGTNGLLTFFEQGGGTLDGIEYFNQPIPSASDPDGLVAPFWDDLIVETAQGTGDKVRYATEGAIGSRVFTTEWYSVSVLEGSTTDFLYMQVKLFEATGDVELHYTPVWEPDAGHESATVGMEDYAGTDGDCGPNCTATNTNATLTNNYRFRPNRPSNDSCSTLNALCLATDQPTVSGTTIGATLTTPTATCGVNDVHDVWLRYYAPLNNSATFSTCSSTSFDTTLAVFDACGGAELECRDDYCGFYSQVTTNVSGGEDYYVRVAGYGGAQGDYTVTLTQSGAASGDLCTSAWFLPPGGFIGINDNNSGCLDETSCGYRDTIDEWFEWTAPMTGLVTVTTCGNATTLDTTLAMFSSCGGTELACNDDDTSKFSECSTIQEPVVMGSTYYIRVAGYNGERGTYQIFADYMIFADGFEWGDTSGWSKSVP